VNTNGSTLKTVEPRIFLEEEKSYKNDKNDDVLNDYD